MGQIWQGSLERLDSYRWKIPTSYKPGMRVPGLIYASDSLLPSILKDNALEQVANVAFLPGIVKYSLAMPDIHWGYGFSIGGVAATDPEDNGVISPGGVGYDINCLCGRSLILNELGYNFPIEKYENIWQNGSLNCMDFGGKILEKTSIVRFLKRVPKNKVFKVTTKTGHSVTATIDHPFYTKRGMKMLGSLTKGDSVAIYPFEGVGYEIPSNEIILRDEDVKKFLLSIDKDSRGHGLEQILIHLKKRNLLPLRYDSPQLPYILKVMGYVFGDGNIYFNNRRGVGFTWFYGKMEDLEQIRQDVLKIGYNPSRIYFRDRKHRIKTRYSEYEFERREVSFKLSSSSFTALLVTLGTPLGNKAKQDYRLPDWIFKGPLWHKRLFLASFFGAEMSSPKTLTGHNYSFYAPVVSMNKREDFIASGELFLKDISSLLKEFNIPTTKISKSREGVNKDGGISWRIRLQLSNTPENMMKLYSRVGFEYNRYRRFLANVATQYLRLKQLIIREKKDLALVASQMKDTTGWSAEKIFQEIDTSSVNLRFIKRSIYEDRKSAPKMWAYNPDFKQFLEDATQGLGTSGMLWDEIDTKEEIKFDGYVYDFTVGHPDHNFIANNFVVSNCGIRLIRSNLMFKDVQPKLENLINGLFNKIPCGVGSSGDIRVNNKEEEEILVKGALWAVQKGYGIQEDIEYTEDKGAIEGADPYNVSERAYERGRKQSGTLGSGNHFIEVQIVDEVFDEKIANVFGLFKGQVTIMLHSGSRGIGYQICDDYVKSMVRCLTKYNINIPDRQLACAPLDSPEGRAYLSAMRCAANYAWANRQCLMYLTRLVFEKIFNKSWISLGLSLVYDVAHNIAKMEKHRVNGKDKILCVHRKGATRAFPAHHLDIPERYKQTGQPVIIPGDMGTNSFVLIGTTTSMDETFASTCHGAGRVMSRSAAIRQLAGRSIDKELLDKNGIVIRAKGRATLAEEAPEAYKDIEDVIEVVHSAGISKKVARMRPLGVIKG